MVARFDDAAPSVGESVVAVSVEREVCWNATVSGIGDGHQLSINVDWDAQLPSEGYLDGGLAERMEWLRSAHEQGTRWAEWAMECYRDSDGSKRATEDTIDLLLTAINRMADKIAAALRSWDES